MSQDISGHRANLGVSMPLVFVEVRNAATTGRNYKMTQRVAGKLRKLACYLADGSGTHAHLLENILLNVSGRLGEEEAIVLQVTALSRSVRPISASVRSRPAFSIPRPVCAEIAPATALKMRAEMVSR